MSPVRSCVLCGARPPSGFVDWRGNFLCPAHQSPPRCYWCGDVIVGSPTTSCATCVADVASPRDLEVLAQRVVGWLGGFFPVAHLDGVNVVLRPASDFPWCQRGWMLLRSDGQTHEVELAFPVGIPRQDLCESLTHEYGHVLLAIDPHSLALLDRGARTDRQEEGFCEVLRWLWIDQHATRDRQFRLDGVARNVFDVYREGFKEVVAALPLLGSPSRLREWLVTSPSTSPDAFARTAPTNFNPDADRSSAETDSRASAPRPVLDLIGAADAIARAAPDPTAPQWSSPRPVLTLKPPSGISPRVPRPPIPGPARPVLQIPTNRRG